MSDKPTEQAAESVDTDIKGTNDFHSLKLMYNGSYFELTQGVNIVFDLTQALFISDFILKLNGHQQILTRLQTENEKLRNELAFTMKKGREANKWIPVSDIIPPFGKLVLLRGCISWKSKDSISYFADVVENDYEILEYGISGYLLKTNNDYLVVNHPNPEEVTSEYITHWQPLPEPPLATEALTPPISGK